MYDVSKNKPSLLTLFDKKLKSEVFSNLSFLFNSSGITFNNKQWTHLIFIEQSRVTLLKEIRGLKRKKY